MVTLHEKYRCYPSVLCVGKETEVTLFPRDISRRFYVEKEYEIDIRGLNADENYQDRQHYEPPYTVNYIVEDGCLRFICTLEEEQEYRVRFREKGGTTIVTTLYAVEKDLFELRPLKGELHSHSYYSDGEEGALMVPANYREYGFDFVALTDHNRMYPSKYAADLYQGIPLGMNIIKGEEIHTPGSWLHIVHIGGSESVCDKYIHHEEEFEKAVDDIEKTMTHVPEQYRRRVAMAKWSCEEAHKVGGIAIDAHPLWRPRNYQISKGFSDQLFNERMFDAFELFGGLDLMGNNKQILLWQEQLLKGNNIPVVGSSDAHTHDYNNTHFGHRFTYVFAKSNKTEDILDAIRNGYSVAGELSRHNDDVQFFHSDLRFVLFAHYLYNHYFMETQRLSFGEGVLMRRYAEGEPVGDLLAAFANTVEDFYKKFYGLTRAETLPKERQNLLDECLYDQQNIGPKTKGSSLILNDHNERRE